MSIRERRALALFDLASAAAALVAAVVLYRGWRAGLWIHRGPDLFGAGLERFAARHPLAPWVRLTLPDALWQYAFVATMAAVWRGERWHAKKAAFVLAPAAIGALVEIGQAAHVVPGTFDPLDLAASVAAAALAILVHGGIGDLHRPNGAAVRC